MAEALLMQGVEGGQEGGGRQLGGGHGELVGLSDVAHLQEALDGDVVPEQAFVSQLFHALTLQPSREPRERSLRITPAVSIRGDGQKRGRR